jgi:multidrug efflux system membrane fusion protein
VTAKAITRSVPVTEVAVGTVEAISTVQVRSQVTGRLAKVHFAEGDEVQAGQPLFTIDQQPFQVALDQANAALARDMAQADNAQAQLARLKNLLDRGLVPREQYETQLATAAALKATTDADRAAVAAAELNLQYTRILAPATGRTGALQAHEGDLIQAAGQMPLVVTNQLAPIYVTFSVPGRLLDTIRRLQRNAPLRVQAAVPGSTGEAPARGRLTFIDNSVDPATGTIKLKATFDNAGNRLWPGQFVDATLFLSVEPEAIVVPSVAVQASQTGPYVFVVDDESRAEMRPVTVARTEGRDSVIATGLTAGEVVVTDGHLRLTPGVRVTSRQPVGSEAGGS